MKVARIRVFSPNSDLNGKYVYLIPLEETHIPLRQHAFSPLRQHASSQGNMFPLVETCFPQGNMFPQSLHTPCWNCCLELRRKHVSSVTSRSWLKILPRAKEETCFLLRKHISSWGSMFPPEAAGFLLRKKVSSWGSRFPPEEARFLLMLPSEPRFYPFLAYFP